MTSIRHDTTAAVPLSRQCRAHTIPAWRHAVADRPPEGTDRSRVRPGLRVSIVQKQDQRTGRLTGGIVRDILTSSPTHPRGIKVRLESGEVGRVHAIHPQAGTEETKG